MGKKVKMMHEKIKSGFLKMKNSACVLLVEVSHGLGCCKNSTRQNKSGKCKAYCMTATTRKSGEKVADHMGHSFGWLRWVGVVGGLSGNMDSATETLPT